MMVDVVIRGPEGEETLLDVETWWYEDSTLWVLFSDGDERDFPFSNVFERLL